jgi:hypothetical protein
MGRPAKEGIEWFKHDTHTDGKTLYTLEAIYGNDGYAFWFKLLELLGAQEGLFYDCQTEPERMYLVAKTRVTANTATEILGTLAALNAIDAELWKQHKVIWVQKFADRATEVYRKRGTEIPHKPHCCDGNNTTNVLSASESTQRREEKRRVEESRENNAPAREGDIFADRSFSDPMKDKITQWLKYKAERREVYKPTGLTSFLSEIENKLKVYPEADIIVLIGECMANNWKGIIWEKIKGRASPPQNSNPFFDAAKKMEGDHG